MLLILILLTIVVNYSNSFNLETRLPIVKRGEKGSYFGFSVAEHQSINEVTNEIKQNWLLVGAPLGQNNQPKTNRSGALWRCPLSTDSFDCDQVDTDGKRTVDSTQLMPPLDDEIKDGQWMGVTVKSQKPGGKVLVCAHRYVRKGRDFQWGQGLCYTLSQELDYEDTWEPCKGRSVAREHEEYGFCQAGTSGVLLDGETAIIGSPGAYTWRGSIFVMSFAEFLNRDKIQYYSPHTQENSPVDKYSYLGMSSTGDTFFSNEMSFAAGAPRANGTGQVVLFVKTKNHKEMAMRLIVPGEQFASSFGYEVASADLNGDKYPELIVGAPFYFTRDEGGAVYIFYNNKERRLLRDPPQKLTGLPESRFGFAISKAGDINHDGYQDLAIGAPYEETGVVYIYLGSADGLIKEPSQVIRGSQINHALPLKTFGYSLSGGVDLDVNGYSDLLVGAFDSDAVVLLRARPIINITTEVMPETALRNIDPTRRGCDSDQNSEFTCFSFQTCCTVEYPTGLRVQHRIEAETFQQGRKFSRVWFGPDHTTRPSNVTMVVDLTRYGSGTVRNCQSHIVYLKENTKDIQSAIKFKLSYTLIQSNPRQPRPGAPLPQLDPILDQQEAAKIVEAHFQKDCGGDDICQSELQTSVHLNLPYAKESPDDWALMLGTTDDLNINVTIENTGESAYETHFFVFHPITVTYNRKDSESKQVFCQAVNKTVVSCQLGNPFKKGEVKFQVKFSVKQVDDAETKLNFVFLTNTTSFEESPQGQIRQGVFVTKKAEISLKGSGPEQVFYGGIVRGESAMIFKDDIGNKVLHQYVARNEGPWRVKDLKIAVLWPHQVANNKEQGKWLLYLDEVPTVDAYGGGQCFMSAGVVNPLQLESRPGFFESPVSSTPNTNEQSMLNVTEVRVPETKLRRRRELRVRSERFVDADGRYHNVVNMNCMNGTTKCLKFICVVNYLHAGQEAVIQVSARLWNSTLVEDYPRVSYVNIASRAQLVMDEQPLLQDTSDDIADIVTEAHPELLDGIESEMIPLWLIVVAVVAGILSLLIITMVLWKCGFFKRNRPDPTLSGNIQKAQPN